MTYVLKREAALFQGAVAERVLVGTLHPAYGNTTAFQCFSAFKKIVQPSRNSRLNGSFLPSCSSSLTNNEYPALLTSLFVGADFSDEKSAAPGEL